MRGEGSPWGQRQRLEGCSQRPGLPAATRTGRPGTILPRVSEGGGPWHLDFRLQASDCERSCCSCCSSAPVCGTLWRQPQDTNKEDDLTPFYTRGNRRRGSGYFSCLLGWELLTLASDCSRSWSEHEGLHLAFVCVAGEVVTMLWLQCLHMEGVVGFYLLVAVIGRTLNIRDR